MLSSGLGDPLISLPFYSFIFIDSILGSSCNIDVLLGLQFSKSYNLIQFFFPYIASADYMSFRTVFPVFSPQSS